MLEDYKKIIGNNPLILWAIPSDQFLHPCATDVSVVFVKNLNTKETCCISFNHPDIPANVSKILFSTYLNSNSSQKWVFDKKLFLQFINVKNLLDINLFNHIEYDNIIEKYEFETSAHKFIYKTKYDCGDLNKAVPILKHKEMFERMCEEFFKMKVDNRLDEGFKKENDIIIETLSELESNGIYVNKERFIRYFNAKVNASGFVYSQYNIYTATGRPSNHFDGVNYAALSKDNGVRSCFISRHKECGNMILIDYSAFHPRIICKLIDFTMDYDVDIYKYLGKLYFNRDVTEYDMEEIKMITMRQFYGDVEEKYKHIKYLVQSKEFINDNWKFFIKNGCVYTPVFKRKITDQHLKNANPTKLFNYILQATETEIAISTLKRVNEYLKTKKTKAILYTYDSVLFDFYIKDNINTIIDIMKIMTDDYTFPIKVYMGDSYNSLIQIYPRFL